MSRPERLGSRNAVSHAHRVIEVSFHFGNLSTLQKVSTCDLVYFVNPDPKTPVIDSHGAATCYRQILFYCVTDPADRKKIDKGKGDLVGE